MNNLFRTINCCILWLTIMFFLSLDAFAASAKLSIAPFNIKAGENKTMAIELINPDDEITLVQFDLVLPDGLSIKMNGSDYDIDISERTTWRKHSLDANLFQNITRLLLASSSNTVISGTEGAIIYISIEANERFISGTIRLENIILVSPQEMETKPADVELQIGNQTPPTPEDHELVEDSYYIKNVGTGNFLTCGGYWGTHIALDNRGLTFYLIKATDNIHWNIQSGFISNIRTEGALGTEGYIDNYEGTDLSLTCLANGNYTITADNGYMLVPDREGKLADFEGESSNDTKAQWMFIKEEDLYQERLNNLENASANHPVDATFLIDNPNINNAHDQRIMSWYREIGNCYLNYGINEMNTEPIMELFRSSENNCKDAFCISQEISNLRPGLYKLEMQGFYRDGDMSVATKNRTNGTEHIYAYLFAGTQSVPIKSIFDDAKESRQNGFSVKTAHGYIPNTMADAGYTFQSSAYNNELQFFLESENSIEIGIRGEVSNTLNNWTTLDNFRLTYYGFSQQSGNTFLSIKEPFKIKVNEEKELIIALDNPEDDITLVQFDLRLPQGLSIKKTAGEYVFDIAGRTTWRKHSLDINETDGIIRFLLASNSNSVLEGNNGPIIQMTLMANNNFRGGEIRLENILLVTPEEKEIRPSDISFKLDPTDINTITTDDNSPCLLYNLSGQRISVPRKGIYVKNGKKIILK